MNLIGLEDNCPITVIGCNDLSTGSHNATVHYDSLRVYYQWWIITDDSCNSVEARITIRCRVLISRKIVIGSKLTQNILEGIEIFSSKISQLRKVINYSLDLATSNVLFIVGHFSPLGTALVFLFELLCIENNQKLVIQEIGINEIASRTTLKTLFRFFWPRKSKSSKKYPKIHFRYPNLGSLNTLETMNNELMSHKNE